jgi:hypothetical protein
VHCELILTSLRVSLFSASSILTGAFMLCNEVICSPLYRSNMPPLSELLVDSIADNTGYCSIIIFNFTLDNVPPSYVQQVPLSIMVEGLYFLSLYLFSQA